MNLLPRLFVLACLGLLASFWPATTDHREHAVIIVLGVVILAGARWLRVFSKEPWR